MKQNSYVIYQSYTAASDMFEAMRILPNRINIQDTHFIDNETAAANLDLARMLSAFINDQWH